MLTDQWHKSTSSHTNGCVEVKATASGANNCVQVAHDPIRRIVQVRDSKLGDQSPVLSFTWWDWAGVLNEVRRGIFDWHRRLYPLEFTFAERVAFGAGVRNGEFDLPRAQVP